MSHSYIQTTLLPHEELAHYTRPHWIIFAPATSTFMMALIIFIWGPSLGLAVYLFGWWVYKAVALLCVVIGVITGIRAFIQYQTSEYGVTNKRILMKSGFIQRNSLEIFLDKVEAVHVDQTIPGRILDYGTIVVIGTGGTKDPFANVPAPLAFRRLVQQQIDVWSSQLNTRR